MVLEETLRVDQDWFDLAKDVGKYWGCCVNGNEPLGFITVQKFLAC